MLELRGPLSEEEKEGRTWWGAVRTQQKKVLPGTKSVPKPIRGLGLFLGNYWLKEIDYSSQKTESYFAFCWLGTRSHSEPDIFAAFNYRFSPTLTPTERREKTYPPLKQIPVHHHHIRHESFQGTICSFRRVIPRICVYEMPEVLEAWYSSLFSEFISCSESAYVCADVLR